MSFSFTAIGTKDEVAEQLALVKDGTHGTGALAPALAQLLAGHIAHDSEFSFSSGYANRYVIKANGHSGGRSPCSLTVSLEPVAVRVPVQAAHEDDGKTAGQRAYEAYSGHVGGISVNGDELPGWDGQLAGIREAWEVAAATAYGSPVIHG